LAKSQKKSGREAKKPKKDKKAAAITVTPFTAPPPKNK
jgi:hypothetical protein